MYPVVIITCVHYLGPPGPFSFPDSRDLLEVLRRTFLAEREGGGSLGDPPGPWGILPGGSLSAQEGPPENLEEVPRIWEGEGPGGSERRSRESGKEKGPGGPRY